MNNLFYEIRMKGLILVVIFVFISTAFSAEIHDVLKRKDNVKLKILIEKDNTLVNIKDKNGKTPLHFAAQTNNLDAIKYLISKGGKINEKNSRSETPLHYAAFMGHKNAVDLLIKNKADLNIKDNFKRTALDFAIVGKHKEIVNLLVKNGIKIDLKEKDPNFIHMVAVNGFQVLFDILIQNGGDLNSLNVFGGTMLHSAVLGELPDIVNLMIKNKVDLNYKDKYGRTALYYAKNSGNKKIISLIKKTGIKDEITKKTVLKGPYYGQKIPGMKPELFAPEIVSRNGSNDRDIAFSNNGNVFYFSKNSRIMEVKNENGIWSDPKTAPFSTGYNEAEAYFTPDNNKIYFISRKPKGNKKTPGPWEPWFAEKKDGLWGDINLMEPQFKGCFYMSFTSNWKMYYTGPDNNIYSSQYKDGKFEKSQKLGGDINTAKAEYNSFIAPDETYLIFTSFGWGRGFGDGDLFISFKDNKGRWQKPVNMGGQINSEFHEYCPYVSPDGKYFFFTSNKLGNDDIYWVNSDIIKRLKK